MQTGKKNLRVGVIGVGSMGRHHVRIVSETPGVILAGLHDPDAERARRFCDQYGCQAFQNLDKLLTNSDAVTVAAPTSLHYEIGAQCLSQRKHVLMEKPLAHNLEYARKLVEMARKAGVILMVGHVERYNPTIQELMKLVHGEEDEIVSIDARRLMPFDGSRCLDVDVLSDLLIHDIDLALEIADSQVIRVSAGGRPVFSDRIDTAHIRIEFANRAFAVFWTGKCLPKKVRTITVATRRRCYEADTLLNCLTIHTADQLPSEEDSVCFMTDLREESIDVPALEPLKAEFDDFFAAVRECRPPVVNGERALRGMEILELVRRSIEERSEVLCNPK